jgi:hypothetical protein
VSRTIKVHLSDEAYTELQRMAHVAGSSPSDEAAASLEHCFGGRGTSHGGEKQAARERFERHFGEVDLGCPTGTDNETIDADLAAEYISTHEQA